MGSLRLRKAQAANAQFPRANVRVNSDTRESHGQYLTLVDGPQPGACVKIASSVTMQSQNTPKALPAPPGDLVPLTADLLDAAAKASRSSARGRIILPLHKSPEDPLQRMLNALQPGSYIQPHRHLHPPRAESLILLRGSIRYIMFSEDGKIQESCVIAAHSVRLGMDTQPGIYHTFFALEPDTVVFEVKAGPYVEASAKDFAPWAPQEGSREAAYYLEKLAKS